MKAKTVVRRMGAGVKDVIVASAPMASSLKQIPSAETPVPAKTLTLRDISSGAVPLPVVLDVPQSTQYNFCLPPQLLALKVEKTDYSYNHIYYYNPKTKGLSYIADTFTHHVTVNEKEDVTPLLAKYREACKSNLSDIATRLYCTIGADPEIFALDNKGDVSPAWSWLPAKSKAMKAEGIYGGEVYWDGFQAEFTTIANMKCLGFTVDSVQAGLKEIHGEATKIGSKLTIDTVVPVRPDVLATAGEEHVQFGCAPSKNAWNLKTAPLNGREVPWRFAGGHIHIGHKEFINTDVTRYVRTLDKILGVASVSLLGSLDNPIRRQFYGLPGEYRQPAHGLEYRVLSNAWLCHPLAMNMVFDMTRAVLGVELAELSEQWMVSDDKTIDIILKNDIDGARGVLAKNKAVFAHLTKLAGIYDPELGYKVWSGGIESSLKDARDLVGNWDLERKWVSHSDGPGKNWRLASMELSRGNKV